jgi:hypothetical protein
MNEFHPQEAAHNFRAYQKIVTTLNDTKQRHPSFGDGSPWVRTQAALLRQVTSYPFFDWNSVCLNIILLISCKLRENWRR